MGEPLTKVEHPRHGRHSLPQFHQLIQAGIPTRDRFDGFRQQGIETCRPQIADWMNSRSKIVDLGLKERNSEI
jgi:hypothetical protein